MPHHSFTNETIHTTIQGTWTLYQNMFQSLHSTAIFMGLGGSGMVNIAYNSFSNCSGQTRLAIDSYSQTFTLLYSTFVDTRAQGNPVLLMIGRESAEIKMISTSRCVADGDEAFNKDVSTFSTEIVGTMEDANFTHSTQENYHSNICGAWFSPRGPKSPKTKILRYKQSDCSGNFLTGAFHFLGDQIQSAEATMEKMVFVRCTAYRELIYTRTESVRSKLYLKDVSFIQTTGALYFTQGYKGAYAGLSVVFENVLTEKRPISEGLLATTIGADKITVTPNIPFVEIIPISVIPDRPTADFDVFVDKGIATRTLLMCLYTTLTFLSDDLNEIVMIDSQQ